MDYRVNALKLLDYLDQKNANLNISKLQVLLVVSLTKDCTVADIMEATGKSQPTVSRCVGDLGDSPTRTSVPGLNWLKAYPDPDDPRKMVVNIGAEGRRVLAEMRQCFEVD